MTEERDETMPGAEPETPEPAPEGAEPTPEAPDEVAAPEAGGDAAPADDETPAPDAEEPKDAAPAEPPSAESLAEALPLVEALLFAASKPVPIDKLAEAAELPEDVVAAAVTALEESCAAEGRGVRLDRVAGGIRLVTRPEYDYPVRRLLGLDGKTKLSMAALETLAIVAYRQPVTAPEVAELRGVNSSSSIRTLLDRKLITTAGRKEVVGTPFLYKTTKEFLVHFGLKALADLPKPEELEAIYGLDAPKGEKDPAQVELFHVDEATGELEEPEGEPSETASPGSPAEAEDPSEAAHADGTAAETAVETASAPPGAEAADAAAEPEADPAGGGAEAPAATAEESPREEEP
jgi:segregation and condensation protein B